MNTLSIVSRAMVIAAAVVVPLAVGGAGAWAASDKGAANSDPSLLGSYLAGRHALSERDISSAAKYFEAALAKAPENKALQRQTFRLLAIDGRIDEAVKLARKLVKGDQKLPLANIVIVIDDAAKRRYAKALKRLEKLPRTDINAFVSPLATAWLRVGLKEPDKALADLGKLTKTNNGLAVLYGAHMGLINQLAGRDEAADEAFKAAAKRRRTPSLRLTQLHGALLEKMGKTDEARALYQTYLDSRPGSAMLDAELKRIAAGGKPAQPVATAIDGLAESMFSIAGAIRQRDSFESTLLFARLALHLKPKFHLARILVAETLEADDRYFEANEVYRAVAKNSPFGWTARLRIAANLERMEKTDDAIRMLRAMGRDDPKRYDALVDLGDLLRRKERYREAVTAYDEAKKRVPEIKREHWTMLYASGIALERSKQWDRAEADFLKALELEPEQPFVLNYLGYSWVEKRKNLERAQKMIEKAVSRRPTDGYIVDSLGWVFYQLGNLKGAVRQLERAVELRPGDPTINDHLGDVYWRVGRRNEARFQWQRALVFKPEKDLITKIKKKLKYGLPKDAKPGGG